MGRCSSRRRTRPSRNSSLCNSAVLIGNEHQCSQGLRAPVGTCWGQGSKDQLKRVANSPSGQPRLQRPAVQAERRTQTRRGARQCVRRGRSIGGWPGRSAASPSGPPPPRPGDHPDGRDRIRSGEVSLAKIYKRPAKHIVLIKIPTCRAPSDCQITSVYCDGATGDPARFVRGKE
jgi:hypothetical protein